MSRRSGGRPGCSPQWPPQSCSAPCGSDESLPSDIENGRVMGWSPQITLAGTFFAVAALAGLVGLWMFGGDPQTEQRLGELADPQSSLLRRRPRNSRQPILARMQALLASLGLRLLP